MTEMTSSKAPVLKPSIINFVVFGLELSFSFFFEKTLAVSTYAMISKKILIISSFILLVYYILENVDTI